MVFVGKGFLFVWRGHSCPRAFSSHLSAVRKTKSLTRKSAGVFALGTSRILNGVIRKIRVFTSEPGACPEQVRTASVSNGNLVCSDTPRFMREGGEISLVQGGQEPGRARVHSCRKMPAKMRGFSR